MLSPTPDAFAALARSSPWRWSTLRFTVRSPRDVRRTDAVRAWLRRPDLLRVEDLHGQLLQVVRERPQQVALLGPAGGPAGSLAWVRDGPAPRLRPDGLVAVRPRRLSYDDPMYQSYFWVAMLDPAELADPHRDADGARSPLVVDTVAQVEHAGRPAWEAVVRPTDAYEPRCGCCPLLRTRRVDELEWAGTDAEGVLAVYPDAYRVRLDVRTGVCVLTRAVGGLTPGIGHDLRIEAVDEPMDDELFRRA